MLQYNASVLNLPFEKKDIMPIIMIGGNYQREIFQNAKTFKIVASTQVNHWYGLVNYLTHTVCLFVLRNIRDGL